MLAHHAVAGVQAIIVNVVPLCMHSVQRLVASQLPPHAVPVHACFHVCTVDKTEAVEWCSRMQHPCVVRSRGLGRFNQLCPLA
jgi:hypothetical protein